MKIMKGSLVTVLLILHSANADDFVCSESGRFADDTDSDCKHYHTCSVGRNGHWIRSTYECPDGTIFDRNVGHCSSAAACQAGDDLSDSSSGYDGDDFECKHPGLHDDVRDPTCSKYYECRQTQHGLLPVQFPCPPPHKFDPHRKHCSRSYVCPRQFTCSKVGRFADDNDETNKKYFLCTKKKNGEFFQSVYTCPFYTRFDSVLSVCVVPDESISDEDRVHDHNLPHENWDHLDAFKCEARGYFENEEDDYCKLYYFCDVNSDGTLAKYVMSCPRGYAFRKETNLCTPGYIC